MKLPGTDSEAAGVDASALPGPAPAETASVQHAELASKARRGISSLASMQAITQVVTLACGIALARVLSPVEFGIYAIATFFVELVDRIGGFGLSASLIQRKETLGIEALSTVFIIQQVSILSGVVGLNLSAHFIASFYPLAPAGFVALIQAVSFTLLMTSWRTMSCLQLERELKYKAIGQIDLIEAVIFQFVALILAWKGLGIWSLAIALLVRSTIGAGLMYAAAPWLPRLVWNWREAKAILAYGIPFQATMLLNSMGTWVNPMLVGPLIGATAVGLVSFSSSNGRKPLILVALVMRVSFAHFSRLQETPALVVEALTRYLGWLLLVTTYWFAMILVGGDWVVRLVYTAKWSPAVPTLILFAAAVSIDCISWLVAQAQAALGFVKMGLKRSAFRAALSIAISIPMVIYVGTVGIPIAYMVAYISTLHMSFAGLPRNSMRQVLTAQLWILLPLIATALGGWALRHILPPRILGTLLLLSGSSLIYGATAWLAAPKEMRAKVRAKIGQYIPSLRQHPEAPL